MKKFVQDLRDWYNEPYAFNWLMVFSLATFTFVAVLRCITDSIRYGIANLSCVLIIVLLILADMQYSKHRRDIEADISLTYITMRMIINIIAMLIVFALVFTILPGYK